MEQLQSIENSKALNHMWCFSPYLLSMTVTFIKRLVNLDTMSFQWTFLATFLYCELAVVAILLLPFISPTTWQKLFKSRLAKSFTAGSKYYFNFIICVFGLLFLDSIRELRKYSATEVKEGVAPHVEALTNMKLFRSQRNVYIAGFALFLWFVIKRLISLLSSSAKQMADSTAARKQAEGAHRHLEGLMTNDPSKIDPREIAASSGNPPRYVDPTQHDADVRKYEQETVKAREDMDVLREQYDNSVREYDKLQEEHRKLQVKLAVAAGASESTKDK